MSKFTSEDIRLAQETEAAFGVPASVTLAQYALESGYGTSGLATKANNYFGITGKNYNTGASVHMSGRNWASYKNKQESFYDHGRLLSTSLYANAHQNTSNPYQYIDAISEIYAPSSDGNNNYAGKLKQIINENNLTQYDAAGVTVDNGSGVVASGGSVAQTADGEILGVDIFKILGKIVKFTALVALGAMAAVFFFNAFNFNIKNAVKKKVVKEAGNDGSKS